MVRHRRPRPTNERARSIQMSGLTTTNDDSASYASRQARRAGPEKSPNDKPAGGSAKIMPFTPPPTTDCIIPVSTMENASSSSSSGKDVNISSSMKPTDESKGRWMARRGILLLLLLLFLLLSCVTVVTVVTICKTTGCSVNKNGECGTYNE